MAEERSKALDYLQNIISSMRECSFKCKEFSILICSAFLTVFSAVNPSPKILILFCGVILFIFWIIDSFYLYKERIFRKEYKRIAEMKIGEEDKRNPLLFSAKLKVKDGVIEYLKSMFKSVSTIAVYLPLIIISVVFGILLLGGMI